MLRLRSPRDSGCKVTCTTKVQLGNATVELFAFILWYQACVADADTPGGMPTRLVDHMNQTDEHVQMSERGCRLDYRQCFYFMAST